MLFRSPLLIEDNLVEEKLTFPKIILHETKNIQISGVPAVERIETGTDTYNQYLPVIRKMIDSLKITKS